MPEKQSAVLHRPGRQPTRNCEALKETMVFKINLDAARCIGCLACTRCDNFVCGNDFKARTVNPEADEVGCNQEAAAICPVGAIIISGPNDDRCKPG